MERESGLRILLWGWLITLGSALLSPAALWAQEPTPEEGARSASPGTPSMRLSEYSFELGTVFHGELIVHKIQVHNDGTGELLLKRVSPSCSCITIKSYPEKLAPGLSEELVIEVEPKKVRPGSTQKRITIETNDPERTSSEIWFSAQIEVPWKSQPRDIKLRGPWDEDKVGMIRLVPGTHLTFEVLEAKMRHGYAEVLKVEQPFGVTKNVYLKAKPGEKPETLKDALEVTCRLRNGKVLTTGVWVVVEHQPRIVFDPPNQILFLNKDTDPLLQPGMAPIVKTVKVRTTSAAHRFEVTSVRLEDLPEGVFTSEVVTQQEGLEYHIRIGLSEYRDESYLQGKVVIETREGKGGVTPREFKLFAKFGRKGRR